MGDAPIRYPIKVTPAKAFFVHTITRDIDLQDAILDLLDNCVDGVSRFIKDNPGLEKSPTPYKTFSATITLNNNFFMIEDNCGGIPEDLAKSYAFRMGRPDVPTDTGINSIGMYGIGMKRALFKMGRDISVKTQHKKIAFELTINDKWLKSDKDWDLYLTEIPTFSKDDGTIIVVRNLYHSISVSFSDKDSFYNELKRDISTQYSFIILKGFKVLLNNEEIKPKPLGLRWSKDELIGEIGGSNYIAPYIWISNIEGVEIKLAVGFYRELPDEDEIFKDEEADRRSELAGWTIVCNNRVILYCDKSKATGWGQGGIPNYHTQFIAISGIVIFSSNNPEQLPLNTTKRGIDQSHELYIDVKKYMTEGIRHFIDYTNKWKGRESDQKEHATETNTVGLLDFENMISKVPTKSWTTTTRIPGQSFKPSLPFPEEKNPYRQIRFSRPVKEIEIVGRYLFREEAWKPSEVGEVCFDLMLEEAKKK